LTRYKIHINLIQERHNMMNVSTFYQGQKHPAHQRKETLEDHIKSINKTIERFQSQLQQQKTNLLTQLIAVQDEILGDTHCDKRDQRNHKEIKAG
jgi:hypothetical protein